MGAAIRLVDHLREVFSIPRRTPAGHLDFDRALFGYRGVLGHYQVRADKTDFHLGFPWGRLVEEAGLAVE